jgi:hypothetical protein
MLLRNMKNTLTDFINWVKKQVSGMIYSLKQPFTEITSQSMTTPAHNHSVIILYC